MNVHFVKISVKEGSKSRKEEYIVIAVSPTDIDAIIAKEKDGEEVTILSTSLKEKLSDDNLIECGSGTFYECVVEFIDDTSELLYMEAASFDAAKNTLEEKRNTMTQIVSIKRTNIVDILR